MIRSVALSSGHFSSSINQRSNMEGLRGHATISLQLGFDGVIPLGQYFMTL